MSKYPATTRVTAGRLAVGDLILVRERAADRLPLAAGRDDDLTALPAGWHKVAAIRSELVRAWRKSTRYYDLDLIANDDQRRWTIHVSAVQRLNRID